MYSFLLKKKKNLIMPFVWCNSNETTKETLKLTANSDKISSNCLTAFNVSKLSLTSVKSMNSLF